MKEEITVEGRKERKKERKKKGRKIKILKYYKQ